MNATFHIWVILLFSLDKKTYHFESVFLCFSGNIYLRLLNTTNPLQSSSKVHVAKNAFGFCALKTHNKIDYELIEFSVLGFDWLRIYESFLHERE